MSKPVRITAQPKSWIAPEGTVWVCHACGKYGSERDKVGDESCFLKAVLCEKSSLVFDGQRVIDAKARDEMGDDTWEERRSRAITAVFQTGRPILTDSDGTMRFADGSREMLQDDEGFHLPTARVRLSLWDRLPTARVRLSLWDRLMRWMQEAVRG